MTFPLGFKITSELLWLVTVIFAAIDSVFISLLAWRIKPATFRQIKWILAGMTAIFWICLWTWALVTFWDPIYQYVFPAWAHWFIAPAFGLLDTGICLLFWRLALSLRGNPVVYFCLLGGAWGMASHLIAVAIGIVTKPPILQGASPAAAIIFAIFEFMLYWCIILSITVILQHGWHKLRQISV